MSVVASHLSPWSKPDHFAHQIIAGEYRLLEARGAGCASCGAVNLRYRYDSLGRQTEQTSLAPSTVIQGKATSPALPLQTLKTAYNVSVRQTHLETQRRFGLYGVNPGGSAVGQQLMQP